MYLTSMNHEELYAEVRKDLIEISTKANLFMDRCRKTAKSMRQFIAAPSVCPLLRPETMYGH